MGVLGRWTSTDPGQNIHTGLGIWSKVSTMSVTPQKRKRRKKSVRPCQYYPFLRNTNLESDSFFLQIIYNKQHQAFVHIWKI